MGQRTDAAIKAWQERAGLRPATGAYEQTLRELSQEAFTLIKIIELEKSGIRDGDGYWHGSDVVGAIMHETIGLCKRVLELSVPEANDVATENERLASAEKFSGIDDEIPF
jgi:hypothetical protein